MKLKMGPTLIFPVFFLLLPMLCNSSHFRGGIIMMEPNNATVSSNGMVSFKFVFRMSWRTTYYVRASFCQSSGKCDFTFGQGSLYCRKDCSGKLGDLRVQCTDCSLSGDWSTGRNEFLSQVKVNSSIQASFTGGDWISGVDGKWELRIMLNATLRDGVLNTSPITAMTPIVVVQASCNTTIRIPVQDRDGDVIRCRWAESQKEECASVCRRYDEKLLETECALIWTSKTVSRNYYIPVALQVEDFESVDSTTPLSSIPLQFLIRVVDTNEPCSSGPVFVSPTRKDGSCIGVENGHTLNETILIDVGSKEGSITEVQTQSPGDLNRTLWKASPKLWALTYTWAPTAGDNTPKIFCFKAIDNLARSTEQRCVTLIPGVPPPKLVKISPQGEIIKDNAVWTLEFDTAVYRPTRTTYVNFHNAKDDSIVSQIDVSNPKMATYEFRTVTLRQSHAFVEKENYYVTLQDGVVKGKEYCGPESFAVTDKSFWTLKIKDTTSPLLTCTSCPLGSSSDVTFAWSINEPATVQCRLLNPQLITKPVDCTTSGLGMKGLSKGTYLLYIGMKDLAGNIAAARVSFYIDTTAPIVRNLVGPPAHTNQLTATVSFSCLDDHSPKCSYECILKEIPVTTASSNTYYKCSSPQKIDTFKSGKQYKFSVRAIDGVVNVGPIESIIFRADTDPPVLNLPNDITVNCGDDASPAAVGKATATDNVGVKEVTYTDQSSASQCQTMRWWLAKDLAGNEARAAQLISFTGVKAMKVNGQHTMNVPCIDADSAINDLKNWKLYLTIEQKCERNISVSYTDNPAFQQCNSYTKRTWEVTDDCGHRTRFTQTLRILPADLPLYPKNGEQNVVLQPRFVWRPHALTNSYQISVWEMNSKGSLAKSYKVYNTYFSLPKRLEPNTKYLWKLVYQQENNQAIPSPTWGFQTQSIPDLAVQAIVAPPTAFTGEDITIEWTVKNLGEAVTATFQWTDGIYIGKTSDLGNTRLFRSIVQKRILSQGDAYRSSSAITIDHSDFGTYFLFVVADRYRSMAGEINWLNNIFMRPSPIEIRLAPPPDLELVDVTLIPETVYSGEALTVKYRVVNSGNGILRNIKWYDKITIGTETATTLHLQTQDVQLLSGNSYERSVKVTVPQRIFGDFNITVIADSNNNVFEHKKKSNNIKNTMLKVRLTPPPDFVMEKIELPKTVGTDELLLVKYTVRNSGIGQNYEPYWYDRIHMISEFSTIRIGTTFNRAILQSGASYSRTVQYRITPALATGMYAISAVANSGGHVFEYKSIENNVKKASIQVVQKLPDFRPVISSLGNSTNSKGNVLNIKFEVVNIGYKLDKSKRMSVLVFAKRGNWRTSLNTFLVPLTHSGNMSDTRQVALPWNLYGDLDIGLHLNDNQWIAETDNTNNIAVYALSVTDARPSLKVSDLRINGELLSGRSTIFEWTVRNQGISDIYKESWVDAIYFASEGQDRSQWTNLARVRVSASVSSGKTYTMKALVPIPESLSGWGIVVIEANENKGVVTRGAQESYRLSVQIGIPGTPDLVPTGISAKQEAYGGARVLIVSWEVENKGNSFERELEWNDVVTVRKGGRKIQRHVDINAKLNTLAQYRQSLKIVLPAGMSGKVEVSVAVDAVDSIREYQAEDNNEDGIFVVIPEIKKPSLSVADVVTTVPSLAGEKFNVTYRVKNSGADLPSSSWQDGIYIYDGDDPTPENIMNGGVVLGVVDQSRALASGESYDNTVQVALPSDTAGKGKIYILTRLGDIRDGNNDVLVTAGANANFNVKPMPLPDLEVVMLPEAFTIETEEPFDQDFTVKNTGEGKTMQPWWEKLYLSEDAIPDPFDKVLKTLPSKNMLGSNESYTQSVEVRIPSTVTSGQYYLLVETGIGLQEANRETNIAWKPVVVKQLPPSDLQVVSVKADKTDLMAGQEFTMEWTLANAGIDKAHGYKCDNQYLSKDTKWQLEDDEFRAPICGRFEFDPFQDKNKTYKHSSKNTVPFTTVGQYYGLVRVSSNVYDVNPSNNLGMTVVLDVSTPVLKLGFVEKITMTGTKDRMYRISNVPEESVLMVELKAPADGAFHNLYLKKHDMPTSGDYDVRSEQPFSVSQTIVFTNSAPGDFYLLVTRTAEKNPYEIQLLAKIAEFEIHSISPRKASLADNVTFTVNGALFNKDMKASLVGNRGEIFPVLISVASISKAYVTFALKSHNPGEYYMTIKDASIGKVSKSNSAITLSGTLPPGELSVQFSSGRALRIGETGALTLLVQNVGHSDVPVPVFLLSAKNDGIYRPMFEGSSVDRSEFIFLAPTIGDYWRSLTPGSRKEYSFMLPSPAEPGQLELALLLISEGNYKTFEEHLRSDLRDSRKDLDNAEWGMLWGRFISLYGDSFGAWKSHVLNVVNEQVKYNRHEYDFSQVMQFLLNLADGLVVDHLLDESSDIWEPTVPDIMLSRKYSVRMTVSRKIGYFGVGWTSELLDFELLEMGENFIGLLVQRLPIYLMKIGNDAYRGQGYTATVNGTRITVTAVRQNVKYVINVSTKKVERVLFQNRHLEYSHKDSAIEMMDENRNKLIMSLASHVGHTLCKKAVLETPHGQLLHSVDYEYDPNSPRLHSVTGSGNAVSLSYGTHGYLDEIQYGNKWRDIFRYDSDQIFSSLQKTNPDGAVVQTATFRTTKFGTLFSTAHGVTSETVYDVKGRQIAFSSSDEAIPFIWETVSDGTGFKLRIGDDVLQSGSQEGVKVTGVNANRGRSSTTANPDGSVEMRDAANNVIRMEIDENEQLKRYVFPDGLFESYTYDKRGLVTEVLARDGIRKFMSYDSRGRLENVTMHDGFLLTEYVDQYKGNTVRQLASQDDEVNIEYNEANLPVTVMHSDEHNVRYTWNELRQVTSIKTTNYAVSYKYNSHGKLVSVSDDLTNVKLGQFEYDALGQLEKKTLGNGDYATYAYDPITRKVKSLRNLYKNGTVASYFSMTYNKKGQRTKMETIDGKWIYIYDAGGEIVSWTSPDGVITSIDYDKVLNRLAITKGNTSYAYKHNEVNQVTKVDTLKLQYDRNGNLIYKENADGSILRMRYNSVNQLTWMDNDKYSCSFVYDPFGALMKQNCSNGRNTRYLSDYLGPYGYNVLAVISNGRQENFHHAVTLGLLSCKDGTTSRFYHFDPDSSTVAVTDSQSNLLNSYKYGPFGENLGNLEQWLRNPFRHRGQLGVLNVPGIRSMYLARARVYDPELGHFISMDPFHHGRQGTTNTYAYCNNNPVECKDPNGKWVHFVVTGALIGGIANTMVTTGWSLYSGWKRDGKTFTESLPSLGTIAGSFVSGAITGGSIAAGSLPGAMIGTTLAGGFLGGATGTVLKNAVDGQPQNVGSTLYEGVLNGLGAKFLPPGFIGPKSSKLNNMAQHSYMYPYLIEGAGFGESMKKFFKPFASTNVLGSALGIFAGRFPEWAYNKLLRDCVLAQSVNPQRKHVNNCVRERRLLKTAIDWVRAFDPNDILGPVGYGDFKFVPPEMIAKYKIRFENVANASAPAQKVIIRTQISKFLELRTFRLGPIGFGDTNIKLDYSNAMHRSTVDLSGNVSRSRPYAVRIQAGIDVIDKTAWWELTTVNASTGELIPDPLIGFLPPNNNASDGEGYVTYEIVFKPSLPHMTKVKAKAAIIFDQNEVIETPEIFNTVDATKPSSTLVVQSTISAPVLQVVASDTGASVRTVNVYRLGEKGTLEPFLQGLDQNAAVLLEDLPGRGGEMQLVSIARDHVGNTEEKVIDSTSFTTVSVATAKSECPANCSGNGNCSSSGICSCNSGFVGLNCSQAGSAAEPPVLVFWVANSTNGTANGFIGYRLLSAGSYDLFGVKLSNISGGIGWTGKGKVDESGIILTPGEVGNFSLAIYCYSRVGWHQISAWYGFKPVTTRQHVIARFYITPEDCKTTTVPPFTRFPGIIFPIGAEMNRPGLVIIILMLSLAAAILQ